MTLHPSAIRSRSALTVLLSLGTLSLSACAGGPLGHTAQAPLPVLPTEQYPLRAETSNDAINLRVNPNGLSENQRRALDRLADRASWVEGEPLTLEIVTSGTPAAIASGRNISAYLIGHHVAEDTLSSTSRRDQPDDVVTINVVSYRAHVYECNRSWENVAATGNNAPYKNFGCAVASNLAAQIADPRDLYSPAPPTPADAERKSTVLDHYRKGDRTGAETDDNAKGTVSQAIQ